MVVAPLEVSNCQTLGAVLVEDALTVDPSWSSNSHEPRPDICPSDIGNVGCGPSFPIGMLNFWNGYLRRLVRPLDPYLKISRSTLG